MINVLLNLSNFDEPWAIESLAQYLKKDMQVCILPLSYNEGWIIDAQEWREAYGKGEKYYEELVRPFHSYGIQDNQISWVNYYEDTTESAKRKIENSDVLFFTGGYPDWMMQRIYDLQIGEAIQQFDGIIMGTSAGALIQLEEYHLAPDEDYEFQFQEGLGLLKGFDIDVHYEENVAHLGSIIRSLEERGNPVLAYPNEGGAIIDGEDCQLLGDAFIAGLEDLDALYQAYEDAKSREDG